jgi:hypothetical protein
MKSALVLMDLQLKNEILLASLPHSKGTQARNLVIASRMKHSVVVEILSKARIHGKIVNVFRIGKSLEGMEKQRTLLIETESRKTSLQMR